MNTKKKIYNSFKYAQFKANLFNDSDRTCVKCKKSMDFEDSLLQVKKDCLKDDSFSIEDYQTDEFEFICQDCYKSDITTNDPQTGWTLINIVDNGHVEYHCERIKANNVRCNTPIQYEHNIFHPKIGFRIVGSTCIQHLEKEDQTISKEVIQAIPKIRSRADELKNMVKLNNWKYLKPYGDQVFSFHLEIDGVHHYMYLIDEGKGKFSLQVNRNYVFMTFKNARDRENTKLFGKEEEIFAIGILFERYFKAKKSAKIHLVDIYGSEIKQRLHAIGYKFGKTIDKRKARK